MAGVSVSAPSAGPTAGAKAPEAGAGSPRAAPSRRPPPGRPTLIFPAILALLAGLYAGLARVGWGLPPLTSSLAAAHGPLMIGGFLGTGIGLERAVALGRRAGFVFPALTGVGALALVAGVPGPWAAILIMAGSGGLLGASIGITVRQPALHHVTLALGALAWLGGNVLWLAGWPVFRVVPWWIAFLVLTIAGERLELSRVLFLPRAARLAFGGMVAALLAGIALTTVAPAAGARLEGLALLATALWLLANDVARRTVRQAGLTRFIAAAMLSGYVWLAAGGALLAVEAASLVGGPPYDAALHAVFVGFVFSMIFGHAPIILPAVLRVVVRYGPLFYAHLALLHLSLVLRVGGDLGGWWELRRWGALLNVAAILLFVATTVRGIRRGAAAASGHRAS